MEKKKEIEEEIIETLVRQLTRVDASQDKSRITVKELSKATWPMVRITECLRDRIKDLGRDISTADRKLIEKLITDSLMRQLRRLEHSQIEFHLETIEEIGDASDAMVCLAENLRDRWALSSQDETERESHQL